MREFIKNQQDKFFMWSVLIMAMGGALYFTTPFEPSYAAAIIVAICVVVGLFFWRRMPIGLRAILVFLLGFCYAMAFTYICAPTALSRNMHHADIRGTVVGIDYGTDKIRAYIDAENLNPNSMGRMIVRATLPEDADVPNIGDEIHANGALFKPTGAAAPGGFDYARWAYFNNLSATGYITDYAIIRKSDRMNINALRDKMHRRANSFLADGLAFGYKNAVPKSDKEIWTTNGIGHVWSISGFHLTLVSGWLFVIFYFLFRAIPYVTRRVPARIPAMMCAWIGLLGYLYISGIGVATIRAFLMTTLVFLAFIFGRNAISMRNICVAFLVIFLMNPHCVMQAGFQLSFSAVFGLIYFWGANPKMPRNKILRVIYAATMTSVIATIFTAPFVAAHFGNLPTYGLAGNLILLPIFSILIMPLVMAGVVCAMFGIMAPLNLAHYVYDFALVIAKHIAALPAAVIPVPNISNAAMICFIFAFACLMFINTNRKIIKFSLFGTLTAIGIIIVIATPKPAFYTTYDNELVAFRENGKLEFNKSRASNHFFAFDTWKQMNFEPLGTPNVRRKHVKGLYIYQTDKFKLAYMQKFVPLQKNIVTLCQDETIDYIVSYFHIDAPKCHAKILRGAFVIYNSGRIKYVTTGRPWHNRH